MGNATKTLPPADAARPCECGGTLQPIPDGVCVDEGDSSAFVGLRCDRPGHRLESVHYWTLSDAEYLAEFGHHPEALFSVEMIGEPDERRGAIARYGDVEVNLYLREDGSLGIQIDTPTDQPENTLGPIGYVVMFNEADLYQNPAGPAPA